MAIFNSHAGSWGVGGYKLPDFGITEKVGALFGSPQTAQGGSNIVKGSGGYATAPQGQTLGATTTANALPALTGGSQSPAVSFGGLPKVGATGTAGAPQASSSFSAPPMEPAPQGPNTNFDAVIQPALDALNQAVAPLQSSYEANIAGIDATTGRQTNEAKTNLANTEASATQNIQRNTQGTESAIDEARRQYSEIGQGIQSRYGGTTGTGKFATEIAGAQTLKNIGAYRTNLQNAVSQIQNTLEQTRTMTQMHLQDLEQESQAQKLQAKAQLDDGLNQIRQMQGQLLGQKAQMAQQAVQQYQQTLQEINARNTSFQQTLYQQQQANETKLKNALSQGEQARKQFDFIVANGTLYKANPFTGAATAVGGEGVSGYGGKQTDGFVDDEEQQL